MSRNIARRDKFKLGSTQYKQKAVANEFIKATEKIQKYLQEEVNQQYGRNAPTISFAFATKYVYKNYLQGKDIK